jgi:hypothetical protein
VGAAAACGGSNGTNGANGTSGEAGAQGDPGTNGTNGTNGTAGAAGEAGAAGQAGDAGATGPQGPQGDAGATGATGPAGEAGPVVILSDTAKHGLDISPGGQAALNLTGLSAAQIEMVGNGSYIVNAVADCSGCHGSAPKFLGGGGNCTIGASGPTCTGATFNIPGGADGGTMTVTPRNLTPDTTTGLPAHITTVDQFIQVIRTGADFHVVDDAGAPQQTLAVMPWDYYRWMSDYDLKSIYQYLTVIPAISNAVPADVNKFIPALPLPVEPTVYTAGNQDGGTPLPAESTDGTPNGTPIPDPGYVLRGLAVNPLTQVNPNNIPGATAETLTAFGRGSYIVNAQAICSECHTNSDNPVTLTVTTPLYLTGGRVFDISTLGAPQALWKPAGNGYVRSVSRDLIGATNGFFNQSNVNFATFEGLITSGMHVEDPNPLPVAFPMPVGGFKNLTLSDMEAIYTYVSTVAKQYGQASTGAPPDKAINVENALYCDSATPCPTGYTCGSAFTDAGVVTANECFKNSCPGGNSDCAICQVCSSGHCGPPSPAAFGACIGAGL